MLDVQNLLGRLQIALFQNSSREAAPGDETPPADGAIHLPEIAHLVSFFQLLTQGIEIFFKTSSKTFVKASCLKDHTFPQTHLKALNG